MNLSQLDLNQLIILKQLLEEKHISNTALSMGLSQPSISRSLSKLRELFDDPLLTRMAGGYELTPKAESIQQDLNIILNKVENLVNKQSFDPKTSEATIKIFGLPPQMNRVIDATITDFRQQAPNITLEIDTLPKPHFSGLLKGDTHFVVTGHEPSSSEGLVYRMPLFKREFELVMSQSHPLADKPLTIEELRHCHFGQISLQGEKDLSIAPCFEALGIKDISIPVRLKDFFSVGTVIENTDIMFHLPSHFSEELCHRHALVSRKSPAELKADQTQVYLYWHKRYHNDPVSKWFRGLVKSKYS
ncbi:LysR family transcriptional regulator [Shewanella electrodiphila]|uniref:LysR family transcriptional regulator n=1 Tax=Shewanella electrodiphila TaxID=934143 RepID=A0ABT0KRL9_9GAMM|nr:LysR family transcriptional regulator [Shewanella electrodiphila]MCL1046403.1 LysR family transcriptional regulator [Shewanella electrodiphila]